MYMCVFMYLCVCMCVCLCVCVFVYFVCLVTRVIRLCSEAEDVEFQEFKRVYLKGIIGAEDDSPAEG